MGEASPKLKLHISSSLTGLDNVQNIIRFVVGIYISKMKIKTPPPNGIILFSPAPPCRTTACLSAWYTRSENSFSCCEPSKLFQSCFSLVSFQSCYDSETKMRVTWLEFRHRFPVSTMSCVSSVSAVSLAYSLAYSRIATIRNKSCLPVYCWWAITPKEWHFRPQHIIV